MINEMSKTFYQFSDYPIEMDEPSAKQLFEDLVRGDTGGVVLATMDGKPVGMLGFIVAPYPLNKHVLIGTELMWWIEEEHRGGIIGDEIRKTAEQIAKQVFKAKWFAMSKLKNSPDSLPVYYKRRGYQKQDETYFKEL